MPNLHLLANSELSVLPGSCKGTGGANARNLPSQQQLGAGRVAQQSLIQTSAEGSDVPPVEKLIEEIMSSRLACEQDYLSFLRDQPHNGQGLRERCGQRRASKAYQSQRATWLHSVWF